MRFELIQQKLLTEAGVRRAKASKLSSSSKKHRKLITEAEGIELTCKLMLKIITANVQPGDFHSPKAVPPNGGDLVVSPLPSAVKA